MTPLPGGHLTLAQARGKQIANGQTGFAAGSFAGSPLIACDGTAQHITVSVSADPSGPPFKNGAAVVSASVSVSTTTFPFTFDSGSVGSLAIRLR